MKKHSTRAVRATVAAVSVPALFAWLEASGLFGWGGDPNGWIRSLPGALILAVPTAGVLLLLYRRLGQLQLESPSLGRVVSFSLTFAVLISLLSLVFGFYVATYRDLPVVLLGSLMAGAQTWFCLFFGGWVQWRKLRPNNSSKPTPLRGAA